MLAWKDICFCSKQLHSSSVLSCTKGTGLLCSVWPPWVSPWWQPDLLSKTRMNSSCFKICYTAQMQPMQLLSEWHTWTHAPKPWEQTIPSRQAPKIEGTFLQFHRPQVLHFLLNPNIRSDFIYSCTQSCIQVMVPTSVTDALLWTALMTPGTMASLWPQWPGHLCKPSQVLSLGQEVAYLLPWLKHWRWTHI